MKLRRTTAATAATAVTAPVALLTASAAAHADGLPVGAGTRFTVRRRAAGGAG
ncbi:hypothetical protein [Streptomyces sp. NBC_00344]|uniref:hypothetical protein n=1 Tax=Streptomyces sp. NBC_00344 TaxID=2975720 RepID=UPI002E1F0370